MSKNLKSKVKELSEIAQSCPENMQEICFELLLKDHLGQQTKHPPAPSQDGSSKSEDSSSDDGASNDPPAQEDFTVTDLHVKTRKFLSDHDLNVDHVNQIFYKEGDTVEPLFDDLKTTAMAESQIRIAMLQAFKTAITTGNFEFNGEDVRSEASIRKCYDPTNFTKNFKTSKSLFDGFEKYDKNAPNIRLSTAGRDGLASLIKELQ